MVAEMFSRCFKKPSGRNFAFFMMHIVDQGFKSSAMQQFCCGRLYDSMHLDTTKLLLHCNQQKPLYIKPRTRSAKLPDLKAL
jgi:hypothetical protein